MSMPNSSIRVGLIRLLFCAAVTSSSSLASADDAAAFNAVEHQRKTIYHSPRTPGLTSWCGAWTMPDGSLMVSFTQATGPVEGRPQAPKEVQHRLSWPPPGHPGYDMTGLDMRNVHLRSTDAGKTWKGPITVVPAEHQRGWGGEEFDTAELPNGDLLCVFRRSDPDKSGNEVRWQGVLKKNCGGVHLYGINSVDNRFARNIIDYTDPQAMLLAANGATNKSVAECDHNVYFLATGQEPQVRGIGSLSHWKKLGFDQHSLVADPLFFDAKNGDYRLRPESPAFRLGFQPIPVDKIGPRTRLRPRNAQ